MEKLFKSSGKPDSLSLFESIKVLMISLLNFIDCLLQS
jgi:hypothetical protein